MSVSVDISRFQAALRLHIATSSRTMANVVNMHTAGVLMRAFLLLPPKNPTEQRNAIRAEMNAPAKINLSGTLKTKSALLMWSRRRAGKSNLPKQFIASESNKFASRRQASVGSVKSVIVKMLRKVMPSFTQFGRSKGKRSIRGNSMLIRLASEYGHSASNVGVSRNVSASGTPATPQWSPTASASGSLKVKPGQETRVNPMYLTAFNTAIAHETTEMLRHINEQMLDDAELAGFTVK